MKSTNVRLVLIKFNWISRELSFESLPTIFTLGREMLCLQHFFNIITKNPNGQIGC